MAKAKKSELMTHEEFVLAGIKNLRKEGFMGIHAVYSGFNAAMRDYYGIDTKEVVKVTKQLEKDGVIVIKPSKGGVCMYIAEELKTSKPKRKAKKAQGNPALAKILAG